MDNNRMGERIWREHPYCRGQPLSGINHRTSLGAAILRAADGLQMKNVANRRPVTCVILSLDGKVVPRTIGQPAHMQRFQSPSNAGCGGWHLRFGEEICFRNGWCG